MVQQVNMIDQTHEKRYFSSDSHGADTTQSRVGARTNPYNQNQMMATKVSFNGKVRKDQSDLLRSNFTRIGSSEKNFIDGQIRITQLCENLNLKQSDVLNEANKLLKDIEDNKALKGHSLETKVACVIVFASR